MLIYPAYFSAIASYVAIAKAPKVQFEVNDNFQKQTYRNRCYIYGANGKQLLNIPVLKANSSQKTKDVKIDYSENWQKQHEKAIASAYKASPFYEFFEHDLAALFSRKETFLLDFNLKCHDFILDALQEQIPYTKTNEFIVNATDADFRYLVNAKSKEVFNFNKYTQVFDTKYGFIENLSILDLLFMEGTTAFMYLQSQKL